MLPARLVCSSNGQKSYRGSGEWVRSSFDLIDGGEGEEFQSSREGGGAAAELAELQVAMEIMIINPPFCDKSGLGD
ncbi:hypothetical protein WISP_112762 [Willisornis vidua]|uniref:Uncharacterized protein n=1 Tax=Willisornis vidua TaxID=1566151 RepID=A0ABQ9CV19_9PASS|nr:hypothetical protein WISP_112762 [Willisornis vidua]